MASTRVEELIARWRTEDGVRRRRLVLETLRMNDGWAAALAGFPGASEVPGDRDLRRIDLRNLAPARAPPAPAWLAHAPLAGPRLDGAHLDGARLVNASLVRCQARRAVF